MGVFEIIREARKEFPSICKKALESLFNILQGLQPEELVKEPANVTEPMFEILLDLASGGDMAGTSQDNGENIRALACACLVSFSVALGDTGKLLQGTSTMLMSPKGLEKIRMPAILVNLQRSVISVMLGKTEHPDEMSQGIPINSNLDTFPVNFQPDIPKENYSIASDGVYIYLQSSHGLYKIGTGHSGTVKGRVYQQQQNFDTEPGWLGFAGRSLYFKPKKQSRKLEIFLIDRDTLTAQDLFVMKDDASADYFAKPYLMLSDGNALGAISMTTCDNFVIRFLNIGKDTMSFGQELPLKLARKCVDCLGASLFQEGEKNHAINFGCDEEAADVKAGKEFAFMLSAQGKLYFSGKASCVGQKQTTSQGQWIEMALSRAPKMAQISIGHDGQHALLLTDDGVVYFTGTARRGEDGDQTKNRRQPKPVKPKKFSKVDGVVINQVCYI